jgi:hypothetical protein
VIRLEAETKPFDEFERESDGGDEPYPLMVFVQENYLSVAFGRRLETDDVLVNVLMHALFTTDPHGRRADPERDAEALEAFTREVARDVLIPRLEGIAGAISGLLGPMTPVPELAPNVGVQVAPIGQSKDE